MFITVRVILSTLNGYFEYCGGVQYCGVYYIVIWSAAVRHLIYLARESQYWAKRKLSPISVPLCQINQIPGMQLTKQLFYYSHLEY